jgi:hypothetical protein
MCINISSSFNLEAFQPKFYVHETPHYVLLSLLSLFFIYYFSLRGAGNQVFLDFISTVSKDFFGLDIRLLGLCIIRFDAYSSYAFQMVHSFFSVYVL